MKLSDNFAGATPLTDAELYATLTTALVGGDGGVPTCGGQILVVPGNADPSSSVIVSKVNSATPVCGAQMPFNCATSSTCLTSDQVNVITAWITAGAPH